MRSTKQSGIINDTRFSVNRAAIFRQENEQSVRIVEGLRECGARSSPSIINDTRFSVNRAAIFRQENEQSVRIVEGLRECEARSSPSIINDTRLWQK